MFANEDEKLWPGEFVNARVLLETRNDVVVIPPLAVQRGPHGLFTWVVKPDNTVEPRPIETGADDRRPHHRHVRASTRASASSPMASTSCRPMRR